MQLIVSVSIADVLLEQSYLQSERSKWKKFSRVKLEKSLKEKKIGRPSYTHILEILFASFFTKMGLISIVNICPEVPTCNFQIFTIRIRTVWLRGGKHMPPRNKEF